MTPTDLAAPARPLRRRALPALAFAFLAAAVLLPGLAPRAAAQLQMGPPKATVELFADRTSYAPGEPARIAARVVVEDHWHINSHTPTFEWLIPTALALDLPEGWAEPEITYPQHEIQSFTFAEEPLAVYDGEVVIFADLVVPEGAVDGGATITGVLSFQACDDKQCLPPTEAAAEVTLAVGAQGESAHQALFSGTAGPGPEGTLAAPPNLALILLLGLLGGLILNAMPCVLPVLSLKVFGLVKSAGQGRGAVVTGALATAAGIVISFWGLAAAAVIARAAGAAVGWGVQFQNPVFVIFLLLVVVLFCLNLWGLFEIQLPQLIARTASSGPREGIPGHLASGFFATLMATPCSAPFLGTAIAFALSQTTVTIFLVFTAVGVGMALPYFALALAPGAARMLPKPGPWMDTLRRVMGFLLAGAAVWLLYVLGAQVSLERRAWVELTLLAIALLLWLRHQGALTAFARRATGLGTAALIVLALGLGWQAGAATAAVGEAAPGLIPWQTFDRAEADRLAAAGELVFVDVTADWCFTCKVNERLVLETEPVAAAFARHGVVPMKADWTNRDDAIARFLADHGRYGIPFYLLYRPGEEPRVFSELLTKEGLIAAIDEAAAKG